MTMFKQKTYNCESLKEIVIFFSRSEAAQEQPIILFILFAFYV